MKEFLAHLHPLLVHLPIGILLLAVLFAWMGRNDKHRPLLTVMPVLLRTGAATAVLSCSTGWLLGGTAEYDPEMLQWHRWLGIATAVLAIVTCFLPQKLMFTTVTAIILVLTGHFGGSMTHGEDYLTAPLWSGGAIKTRPDNLEEAQVYGEIIAPIFSEKCNSCHGSSKQKGGLRLDQPGQITKGGKDGPVIKPGDPVSGELLRRCLLPLGNDDHMPPREKPQLTTEELEILRWWLSQGADFQRKTKELPLTESVRKALVRWQKGNEPGRAAVPDIPEKNAAPAPAFVIEKLRRAGVLVLPVSRESHWLSVSFVNLPQPPDSVFSLLEKIAQQTVWLNMSHCTAGNTGWAAVGKLTNLTRLSLDYSPVSDSVLSNLKYLYNLQYLNLAHTKVTPDGLRALEPLKQHLRHVYLYETGMQGEKWEALKAVFPQTTFDTGGYRILFMQTDTARVKAPEPYK